MTANGAMIKAIRELSQPEVGSSKRVFSKNSTKKYARRNLRFLGTMEKLGESLLGPTIFLMSHKLISSI